MRKIFVIFAIAFFLSSPVFCQNAENESTKTESHGFSESLKDQFTDNSENEVVITHLWSLDFILLATQLANLGIGFGVQYEQQFFPHFAGKGYFGHATINTRYEDIYCITVSFGLFTEWYPLSRQMRKLYVGFGGYFDYLGYTGDNVSEDASGTILSVIPQIGYKFSLPWHFLLDLSCGYKYVYRTEGEIYGNAAGYLKRGFQYGIGLKWVPKQ